MHVHRLSIIFTLMFERVDEQESRERLEEGFKGILQLDYERSEEGRSEGLFSKTHHFLQAKLNAKQSADPRRWLHLEQSLRSIVTNVRASLPLGKLLPLITRSLLSENSTSPVISLHSIETALPAVAVMLRVKDRQAMREEVDLLPFPVLSVMLWRAGCEEGELQAFYEGWLRVESEHGAAFERKGALYQWLNMLCLSMEVEPRGEFFLFNSKVFSILCRNS